MIREQEAKKANDGGKMPYNAIPGTVLAKQHIFPWIYVDQVKNELKKVLNLKLSQLLFIPLLICPCFNRLSTAAMSTLTPILCDPTKPLFLNADGSFALLFPSNSRSSYRLAIRVLLRNF